MQYVALLRGIGPGNPAQRNENLRGVLERLGFLDVRSVIASGNLVFTTGADPSAPGPRDPAEAEELIEPEWPLQLGFVSTTVIRTAAEFTAIAGSDWFGERPDDRSARLQVTFLKSPADGAALADRLDLPGVELIAVDGREIAWSYDQDSGVGPKAMAWLDRTFAKKSTTRTWRTVQRIARVVG